MLSVRMTGAWNKVRGFISRSSSAAAWKLASKKAINKEAERIKKEIVKSFDSGGPAGAKWAPLSPMTKKIYAVLGYGSTTPLKRTGRLQNSVVVKSTGKETSISFGKMGKIAAIHEFGAGPYAVPVTEKMRRFFKFLSAASNGAISPISPEKGVLIIKIPARPIIAPIVEKQKATIGRNVMKNTLKDLGYPGI